MKYTTHIWIATFVFLFSCGAQASTLCPKDIFTTLTDNRTCNYLVLFDGKWNKTLDLNQASPDQGDWSYAVVNMTNKRLFEISFSPLPIEPAGKNDHWQCPDFNGDARAGPDAFITGSDDCRVWTVHFRWGLGTGDSGWFSAEGDKGIKILNEVYAPLKGSRQ